MWFLEMTVNGMAVVVVWFICAAIRLTIPFVDRELSRLFQKR